ncbi:putative oxidoreductase YusZ [Podospora aff. communis PSN243]|uniref:Oxidoreductase YusZ n=1 Tax=Podospora aff. communis PSN243 TaxID=3040156 RepID=A0AAV9GPJ1_9PEZI|nr:putative oxidoreductase YusZ [Podospora aff. communis PSN243]
MSEHSHLTMSSPVWFITATSSGFGKAIALEALQRGHKVIATARNSSKLAELKEAGAAVMDLDVTADDATLAAKLSEANAMHGKITHVVNAAGYILVGAIEEASQKEVFDQYNTNVFGSFNIARAAAPYLRAAAAAAASKGIDTNTALANFGSLGSWRSGAGVAHYCSTKFAVTGLTEGLREELKPFGIDVCVIEPGYTRTGFLRGSDHRIVTEKLLDEYQGTETEKARGLMAAVDGNQPGDVDKCAKVIVDVLTRKGGREVPVRLLTGSDAVEVVKGKCNETLQLVSEWEEVSSSVMY